MEAEKIKLFLVDDDAVFLKSLEIQFRAHPELAVETYATGERCMENLSHDPKLVILDYHLDGIEKDAMNGMQILDQIKSFNADIPVVILSAQDKIEVAIDCMHHRAFDYLVKDETGLVRLEKIISGICDEQSIRHH